MSTTQTASQSIQPFWQGLLTDRQTDHATLSVTICCIYVRCSLTAWRSGNIGQSALMLCGWGVKADMVHSTCG